MSFIDRDDAGRQLAHRLGNFAVNNVVVLGLPRGGVPVAAQVARQLEAPLDVILVRKLGVPNQPELAMGAIGEEGVCTVNEDVIRLAGVTPAEFLEVEMKERIRLENNTQLFRGERPRVDLNDNVALIVDDGLATGATAIAACEVARAHGAKYVVVAVPVAPVDGEAHLKKYADEFISVETPVRFDAVGAHYQHFEPVSDENVIDLLDRARAVSQPPPQAAWSAFDPAEWHQDVHIPVGGRTLPGRLSVPEDPIGVVLFAHGSGSSRHSPRNSYVAEELHHARLATLLFDLLTREEEFDRANVFDIALLARRLHGATDWIRSQPQFASLPIGYFGASTGGAAALVATTLPSADIAAIVSRGGRPDLANGRLGLVRTPTLLLVGGDDGVVVTLNEGAAAQLQCEHQLTIVPGATHLFEEPGALRVVANEASRWFVDHMTSDRRAPATGSGRTR